MLDDLDIPVEESDLGSGAHFETNSVAVIAEPRTDDTTLEEVRAMLDAPTVLLVLPEREGKADSGAPELDRRRTGWWPNVSVRREEF